MAILYSEARSGLQDIANNLSAVNQLLDRILQELDRIKTAMTELETKYAGMVTEINTMAANNPGTVWTDTKVQKDELVANFNALRTRADSMISALNAI